MKPIGIIANPASGKDIRRLIASGTVVTNQEKINIVIRMVRAIDALGVEEVFIMPDPTHIGRRVIDEVESDLTTTRVRVLEMPYILGTWKDTRRAVARMQELGFGCIVVMGGDGTSRIAAKSCGEVPLVPVSTGTNNVFPQMVEGTLAGLAAATIVSGAIATDQGCKRAPLLELVNGAGELVDTALVDLAVVDARDIGSRAVWEPDSIRELFLTSAHPAQIGLSSIGGWLQPLEPGSGKALHVRLGPDGETLVLAPIAPGLMKHVRVEAHQLFGSGDLIPIRHTPSVVALDGERELVIPAGESMSVRFNSQGPLVVDLQQTLVLAAAKGLLRKELSSSDEWPLVANR